MVVSGPPGVGKTALVSAAVAGTTSRWGHGLASLAWRPLVPLSRALSTRLSGGTTADIADLVADLIGDDILVLDDAQFADPATLTVMTTLAQRIPMVAIVRTGEPLSGAALQKFAAVPDLVRVVLGPLGRSDAADLCRALGADDDAATRIAVATGGSPLWCVRSVHDVTALTLVATISAQLDRLDVGGRTVVAALGLAGRPLLASVLGQGIESAQAAGLVITDGELVRPVHPRVSDIAAGRMTDADRAALHHALGERLADPGEAARHFIAAGDRMAATCAAERALSAARGLTERAVTAGLVAAADGTARSALVAARWWLASGDPEGARTHVAAALADPAHLVEACAVAACVARRRGDLAGAAAHLTAGVRSAEATGDGPRRLLDIELLSHDGTDDAAAAELVDRCAGTAEEPQAALVRAVIGAVGGDPDWQNHFRELRRAPDPAVLLEALFVESTILMLLGRVDEALIVASEGAESACTAGAIGWTEVFQRERWWMRVLGCREPLAGTHHRSDLPVAARALLSSDAGFALEADDLVASAPSGRRRDAVRAALAWAGGDEHVAATMAGTALGSPMDPVVAMLAGPVAAWTGVPWESPLLCEALLAEAHVVTADSFSAISGYLTAAALWREVSVRATVRCSWAAADRAVRAGDPRAKDLTEMAIEEVRDSGIRAFDSRLSATARQAGLTWNTQRGSASHGLTARETEVLRHVGRGLSSAMIARRLGVSVATVETHVRSAVLKLGTSNRRAAAAKLA